MKIAFAYFTFVMFIPFAYLVMRRMERAQAAAIVVIVGSILLPEVIAVDLPVVPPIDKEYLTYTSTLVFAFLCHRRALLEARPGTGLEMIVILIFLANIGTAMMNPVPMMDEGRLEDGLGAYWIAAKTADDVLTVFIPFLVGRAMFRSIEDLYVFLKTLVIAATGYTALIVLETVMSVPFRVWQLAQVIYGLPARVNMRWGLAQPVVFFDNGLALATFMAVSTIAAAAIARTGLPLPWVGRGFGLPKIPTPLARNIVTVGLLLARNVAGMVYGVSFFAAYALARKQLAAMLGLGLVLLACIYPTLRMVDLFPYEEIVEFARQYLPERAHSLEGRFLEEEHVLGQIGDRLWLGWGTYSRIPGAEGFGQGEVGLDGWVTIKIGTSGVLGVALYYFVFAAPAIRAWFGMRRTNRTGQILLGAMIGMVAIRMIDMIINGWWNCFPIFLAGVTAGVTGGLGRSSRKPATGSSQRGRSTATRSERPVAERTSAERDEVRRTVSTAELLQAGRRPDDEDR